MKNRDYVRSAYDEIHVPDALFGKVINMKKENKTRSVLKSAAIAFGAFIITFVASNGICYAATGETWVGKAIVYINGEKQEHEITYVQEGDKIVGEIEFEVDEQQDMLVRVDDEADGAVEYNIQVDSNADASSEYVDIIFVDTAILETKNDKVYLVIYDKMVDITEDYIDGEASGRIDVNGQPVIYIVKGNCDEYEITLNK